MNPDFSNYLKSAARQYTYRAGIGAMAHCRKTWRRRVGLAWKREGSADTVGHAVDIICGRVELGVSLMEAVGREAVAAALQAFYMAVFESPGSTGSFGGSVPCPGGECSNVALISGESSIWDI
jgi:hypothetical protein